MQSHGCSTMESDVDTEESLRSRGTDGAQLECSRVRVKYHHYAITLCE